ncbi:RT0821/Lpp0805 family surface protein [Pseudoroseomonas globiformis]|uniref:RT0821/Lpp0805 family surface protein n=1 Tax=Teichococcus globiformis TaxID=2307229 RepID=A0ABV7G4K9_9PROT
MFHPLSILLAAGLTLPSLPAQWRAAGPATVRLSPGDLRAVGEAANSLLAQEPPALGQSARWSNAETGRNGAITLLDASVWRNMPCRRMRFEVTAAADLHHYELRLCRIANGQWKIAE